MRTPAKTRVQVPQNAHSDTKQALSVANSGLTKLAERYANTNSPGRGGHGLAITLSFKAVAWLRTAVSGATVSSSPPAARRRWVRKESELRLTWDGATDHKATKSVFGLHQRSVVCGCFQKTHPEREITRWPIDGTS